MAKFSRWHYRDRLPIFLAAAFLITNSVYFLIVRIDNNHFARVIRWSHPEQPVGEHITAPSAQVNPVPCIGPRGTLLTESADDHLNPQALDMSKFRWTIPTDSASS